MASDDDSIAERVQARKVLLVNLDEAHGREVAAVAGIVHSSGTHETAESSLTSLRWKIAHSDSADINPCELVWTTPLAWDDEALLNEILDRVDNEIVLLGVSHIEDVAVSELAAVALPACSHPECDHSDRCRAAASDLMVVHGHENADHVPLHLHKAPGSTCSNWRRAHGTYVRGVNLCQSRQTNEFPVAARLAGMPQPCRRWCACQFRPNLMRL